MCSRRQGVSGLTWLNFAAKNVRHQARAYAAFFLSSVVAIWLFYSFASLLLHPHLASDQPALLMRDILQVLVPLVAAFAVLFILYAFSAFLKSRQRDLGIISLLGARPWELTRLLYLEISLIGLGATVTAIFLALITQRLFFLGISRILDVKEAIPVQFSLAATLLTGVSFALIFLLIAAAGHLQVRRLSPAALIREAGAPQQPPRFSWWLVLLCWVALALTYSLALTAADGKVLEERLGWILGAAVVGTYLLYSQASLYILRWLQRRPAIYYRHTNLLTISQLLFKVKENARILFMVSLLTSLALVMVGMYYGGYATAAEQAQRDQPVHLMLTDQVGGQIAQRAEAFLQAHDLSPVASAALRGLHVSLWYREPDRNLVLSGSLLLSVSEYNQWMQSLGRGDPLTLGPGEVAVVYPDNYYARGLGEPLQVKAGEGRPGEAPDLVFSGYR